MPAYRVVVQVEGTMVLIVEAADENEACRTARRRAEMNDADRIALEHQVVGVQEGDTVSADEQRLTPTQRLHEVTMAALNRAPAPPECSVDISRNAKGDYQFAVTVRGHDADECARKAAELTGQLAAQYPRDTNGAT